jgi:hypothetical protein
MRYRWIVSRNDPKLYEYLKHYFAGRADVDVILDRRQGERRQHAESSPTDRRRSDRRQHSVNVHLAALGVALVSVP